MYVRKLICLLVCGCAALLVTSAVQALPRYSIQDLGTLGGSESFANGLNNHGQVVGFANVLGDSTLHATLYSETGSSNTDLGTISGGDFSIANAINDLGQIVGSSQTDNFDTHAALFSSTGGNNLDLGTLGGSSSRAVRINAGGQIVGQATTAAGVQHATLFSIAGGTPTDLDPLGSFSTANGINASGQIVGEAEFQDGFSAHAAVFSGGDKQDLGTLGGDLSYATSININGRIVGAATLFGNGQQHGVLYSGTGLNNVDFGSIVGNSNVALSINAIGAAVGFFETVTPTSRETQAFLWTAAEGMLDLDTLIDPADGWDLSFAGAINDLGQIAVNGRSIKTGNTHALLLTPIGGTNVPTPGALELLGGGIVVLLLGRRSRRRAEWTWLRSDLYCSAQ